MAQEVAKFAFEYARDEYARTAARLALLETKCQLTAAVAAILITILPPVWERGKSNFGITALCALSAASLLLSIFAALKGSIISEVDSPIDAEEIANNVETRLGKSGAIDSKDIDDLWGEGGASYRNATAALRTLVLDRASSLFVAQVALLSAMLFTALLVLYQWGGPFVSSLIRGGSA